MVSDEVNSTVTAGPLQPPYVVSQLAGDYFREIRCESGGSSLITGSAWSSCRRTFPGSPVPGGGPGAHAASTTPAVAMSTRNRSERTGALREMTFRVWRAEGRRFIELCPVSNSAVRDFDGSRARCRSFIDDKLTRIDRHC